MRLWLSLVTVFVLLLCANGVSGYLGEEHQLLEDCPKDSVCLIFGTAKCFTEGKEVSGAYVWKTEGTTKTWCEERNYGTVKARLNFRPLTRTKWRVEAALFVIQDDVEVNQPENFSFKFQHAALNFVGKNSTLFSWDRKGKVRESEQGVNETGSVQTQYQHFWDWFKAFRSASGILKFHRYTFDIQTDGMKMIELFGPEVTCQLKQDQYVLNDIAFPEALSALTKCDTSEIKEVCYDTCDKIFPDFNSTNSSSEVDPDNVPNCKSHLWVHSTSDVGFFRKWKKVEKLDCYMGWWRIKWTEWDADATKGTKNILTSDEVQCSIMKPSKMTTIARVTFGIAGAIGGLILVAGVIALIWFLNKRKRRHHHHHHTERKGTLRDSDSKSRAQTPGGKSTEREKY